MAQSHTFVRRAAARADRFASLVAFRAAAHVVAGRHGVTYSQVVDGLSDDHRRATGHFARGTRADEAQRLAAARREAIYLAVTVYGRGQRSLARALGLHHEAVRKALAKVEDRREDARYDRALDVLELELMGAA